MASDDTGERTTQPTLETLFEMVNEIKEQLTAFQRDVAAFQKNVAVFQEETATFQKDTTARLINIETKMEILNNRSLQLEADNLRIRRRLDHLESIAS